jgi:hypothetical protein
MAIVEPVAEHDIAVGHVVGSNTFNILGCLGLSWLLSGNAGLLMATSLPALGIWLTLALACLPVPAGQCRAGLAMNGRRRVSTRPCRLRMLSEIAAVCRPCPQRQQQTPLRGAGRSAREAAASTGTGE